MCSAKTGLIAPLGVVLDGLKPCSRCCVLANPNGISQVLDKFSAVYILFNLVLVLNSCTYSISRAQHYKATE